MTIVHDRHGRHLENYIPHIGGSLDNIHRKRFLGVSNVQPTSALAQETASGYCIRRPHHLRDTAPIEINRDAEPTACRRVTNV